ncbi:PAS domain-containing sensor histidine kinase [Deinococcus pimensis]|uniref:PAS domain-containing sensor histidine kinase n=1 Tax=Deinococcus pimensis TaxID=309888 RepID=UPI0004B498A5|nr:ATP-binding protein [Deinococcus pimensis]
MSAPDDPLPPLPDPAALLDRIPQMLWWLDARGHVRRVNGRTLRFSGQTEDAFLGDRFLEVLHPDDRPGVAGAWPRLVGAGKPFSLQFRLRCNQNRHYWFLMQVQPEQTGGWIATGTVVEAQVRAERRLSEVLEWMNDAFLTLDAGDRLVYVNRAAADLVGGRPEDYLGRVLYDAFPDVDGTFRPHYERARREGVSVTFEALYTPLGLWLEVSAHPGGDQLSLYIRDVTERVRARRALEEVNSELEGRVRERTRELEAARERAEVLAALGDVLQRAVTPDEAARVALARLGVALGATAMLFVRLDGERLTSPEVWGDLPPGVHERALRPDLGRADLPVLSRALKEGAVYLDDYRADPDALVDVPEALAFGVEPVRDGAGRPAGALVVWRACRAGGWPGGERDLLRRAADTVGLALERARVLDHVRRQRDELQAANLELRRSNEELERFAYVASHDLQEPLRTVASFTGVLQTRYRGRLDERADVVLDTIVRGAERMKTLVDDLLAFSRLRSVRREHGPVSTAEVLAAALEGLGVALAETGARVVHTDLPVVRGDAAQLTQLLQNLVGNAVKFRREGTPPVVEIAATREGAAWHFTVRDNGIGIEERYFPQIFEIFQRLHTRDRFEGSGVGLAICRRVVEAHGGRLWVDSTPGEGSTFHFTLPGTSGKSARGFKVSGRDVHTPARGGE